MSTSQENLIHLEKILKSYELDNTPSMNISKYETVRDILESGTTFNEQLLYRLLKTCIQDLKPDVQYLPIVLSTVTAILKQVNQGMFIDNLIPSAVAVIKIINDIATTESVGALKIISLKTMCFDTLLAYPDHVLEIVAATKHNLVLDIIDMYCSSVVAPECRNLAFQWLTRLLKALTPSTKLKLVQARVDIWFQKVLPTVVLSLSSNSAYSEQLMEALELLTDTLVELDYSDNKDWHKILEYIYNPEKYPTVLKTMLDNKNAIWHRLWIALIKLLKDQITKVSQKVVGSPINAMLPIVEAAFKMDVDSRVYAYKCWEALIDNFKSETGEAFVMRRMKLLLIPLKSANAKVEQTGVAKINTWWYLIRSFHSYMGSLTSQVLIPFIQNCFGHPQKAMFVPGLLSENLKATCVEMLIEIFGHVNCRGCVTVPKLQNKYITPEILKTYWLEWCHALKIAFQFLATKDSDKETFQLRCLWESVLLTLSELPDNDVQIDMLYNVLEGVVNSMKDHTKSEGHAIKFYKNIILPLFKAGHSCRNLLKTRVSFKFNNSITLILEYLLDADKQVIKTKSPKDLRLITDTILDKTICDPNMLIEWINNALAANEDSAVMWCALSESIQQTGVELDEHVLRKLMQWPITHMVALASERTESFYTYWKALFDSSQNLNKTEFQDIIAYIPIVPVNTVSGLNFKLCVVLVLLQHFVDLKCDKGCDSSISTLTRLLTDTITFYQQIATLFPMLIETFVFVIDYFTREINTALAEKFLKALQLVMKLTKDNQAQSSEIKLRILIPLNEMLQNAAYAKILHIIVDELSDYLPVDINDKSSKYVLHILKTIMSKSQADAVIYSKVKVAIDKVQKDKTNATMNQRFKKSTADAAATADTDSTTKALTPHAIILTPRRRVEIPEVNQNQFINQSHSSKIMPTDGGKKIIKDEAKPRTTPKITTRRQSTGVILSLSPEVTVTKVIKPAEMIGTISSPQAKIVESSTSSQAKIIEKINKTNDETTLKFETVDDIKIAADNISLPKVPHTDTPKDTVTNKNESPLPKSQLAAKNELPAPKNTEFKQKAKKNEPTIVNTVVENGEEYSVVKSHWKFNPRKLTENQREKFKRKREDIPALYQDLSQSQDEVRLGMWKTDSQDTTTSKSTSNSTSAKDFTSILQNLNSTNVIPKIMENVLSDKCKNEQEKNKNSNNIPVKSSVTPSSKASRTPRGPLKDRIFRNVKNLMEKSGLRDNINLSTEILVDESPKTPSPKIEIIENKVSTNSAPSKINTYRPSRLIKKPKKFHDSELISLKRQHSINSSQADSAISEPSNDSSPVQASSDIAVTKPTNLDTDLSNYSEKSIESGSCTEMKTATNKTHASPESKSNPPNLIEENKSREKSSAPKLETPKNEDTASLKNKKRSRIEKQLLIDTASLKNKKRSRIEKQLLIDTVEGHPILRTPTRQRSAKKHLSVKRNSLISQKSKNQNTAVESQKRKRGRSFKINPQVDLESHKTASITVVDSQYTQEKLPASNVLTQTSKEPPDNKSPASVTVHAKSPTSSVSSREYDSPSTLSSQDHAFSEDIIESSQDSSITTMSTKSSKSVKSVPLVRLDIDSQQKKRTHSPTQDLVNHLNNDAITLSDFERFEQKSNEDIELPINKSVPQCESVYDLTENMDTEPFDDNQISDSSDCVIVNDLNTPIAICTEHSIGPETQEIAEADTEPFQIQNVTHAQIYVDSGHLSNNLKICEKNYEKLENEFQDDITKSLIEENSNEGDEAVSSPFKDNTKKNKEFLNDTLEISPIKTLSPVRDKKSPSPETSSDYLVIKLTSPVHTNGEPFDDKFDSPEIFTEDKTSPEKRDQSPPRAEVKITNISPSSSLSLKKNRANVGRGSGRAAQIMGLCASGKLNAIIDAGKSICEGPKKGSPVNTQARRNLRILNSVDASSEDPTDDPHTNDSDSDENFLKFKKMLPTADCSPAGPILKRKLDEITEDTTGSPASKRKRVSFHDPPVSTTIAVQKYIEPLGRSPQNSLIKRQDRQARGFTPLKSQRVLNQIFKLDTLLTKTNEGFCNQPLTTNDSEMSSIEQTPAAEVVKTSDLNNTDPICPDLIDCMDPISNIASDLSSPAMKHLLIKELTGKIDTVADLAKMTELEVNRLCIKAPKVEVAKQVLSSYAVMRNVTLNDTTRFDETVNSNVASNKCVDIDVQTDITSTYDSEVQTMEPQVACTSVQTDVGITLDNASQTIESGTKTTADIIASCLANRPDFVEQLEKQLPESALSRMAEKLTFDASIEVLLNKTETNLTRDLTRLLFKEKGTVCSSDTLDQFTEYLCKRFQAADLALLCSKVLQTKFS